MYTKLQVINFGLSKIASSLIRSINPPNTQLEHFMSNNYDLWKRTEIGKRRWVFALEDRVPLPQVAYLPDEERPYRYQLPNEALRPVRERGDEWRQRGRLIHSCQENLRVSLIIDRDESEFDTFFVDVLACWIALQSCEYVTQSNTKKADALTLYNNAVADAGRNNAFVIGSEDYGKDDSGFPFITERL